ncbi:4-hydroxy-3-methylbut-2-enyl diphosphate reductase [bacterium]|jgi:4-hydroxy-3-methylbut-2-enyl diphosphate reductase|nr:4-hydroxy-3-methylbut-2-enyl diphosphate reductase [bacterium]
MKIKIAYLSGFCMGVRRATDIVYALAKNLHKKNRRIVTYGPLIHNPRVLEELKSKGIGSISKPEDADSGTTVVIRAHGIPPDTREKLISAKALICDATCPDVLKVQSLVKKYANKGYTIIIIGDKGHAEVTGLLGFAGSKSFVVNKTGEINNIPDIAGDIAVVCQTTQSSGLFEAVSSEIKNRFPNAVIYNTICKSTEKRQEETRKLAKEADVMIVLGGRDSANTRRLYEICINEKKPAYYIENADELNVDEILKYRTVGITAGASTPNWMIKNLVRELKKANRKNRLKLLLNIENIIYFIVRTNILIAVSAGVLSYICTKFFKLHNPSILYPLTAGLYIFSMHTFNRLFDNTLGELKDYSRIGFMESHHEEFKALSIITMFAVLICSLILGFSAFIIAFIACIAGVSYGTKLFPKTWAVRRLKDIPMSKNIMVSLAWTSITVFLPLFGYKEVSPPPISPALIAFSFAYISILIFIRCLTYDLVEIHADRTIGKESLAVLKGKSFTKKTIVVMILISALMSVSASYFKVIPSYGYILPLISVYSLFYLYLYHKRHFSQEAVFDLVVESKFILAGLIVYLGSKFTG